MVALTAAVIAVGLLCLIDLLLSFGVIRRLRQHTELLSNRGGSVDVKVMNLHPGDAPAAFRALTTEGDELEGPIGFRLAAFFSSTCSNCPGRVPAFIDYAAANHLTRADVLAVVLTEDSEPVPYLDQLAQVASSCVQPPDGDLATAFGVLGYPAFCVLDADGTVRAVSFDPADLPALVLA